MIRDPDGKKRGVILVGPKDWSEGDVLQAAVDRGLVPPIDPKRFRFGGVGHVTVDGIPVNERYMFVKVYHESLKVVPEATSYPKIVLEECRAGLLEARNGDKDAMVVPLTSQDLGCAWVQCQCAHCTRDEKTATD